MNVTKTIKIELTQKEVHHIAASAVSGDVGSRSICFALQENGVPWAIPEDCAPTLAFRTQDGYRGEYDTLPNGDKAIDWEGNCITVRLIDQITAKAGHVALSLVLRDQALNRLETFPVLLQVEKGAGWTESLPREYYRIRDLDTVAGELDKLTREKGDGLVLDAGENRLFLTSGSERLGEGVRLAGVSPSIGVETIDGGHRVTVTDAGGVQSFDVLDGKDGQNGTGDGSGGVQRAAVLDLIQLGYPNLVYDPSGLTQSVLEMPTAAAAAGEALRNGALSGTIGLEMPDGTVERMDFFVGNALVDTLGMSDFLIGYGISPHTYASGDNQYCQIMLMTDGAYMLGISLAYNPEGTCTLPKATAQDQGKVLVVGADGTPQWQLLS